MQSFFRHRAPITLALLVFIPVACLEKDCGPRDIECEGDRSCPAGSVCRTDSEGCSEAANVCVAVTECTTAADCPAGEPCVHRDADAAEHPFERDAEERGICGCDDTDSLCRPFVATPSTGVGGGAGTGGGDAAQASTSVGVTTSQSGTGGSGGEGTSGATVSIASAGGAGGDGNGGNGGMGGVSATGAGGAATSSTGAGGTGGTP